jgi:hypothetical protein
MDPMSEYLAMKTIEARLAAAHELRPGRRIEEERRAERRRRRRLAVARWWQSWVAHGPEVGAPRLAASSMPALPPSVGLGQVLDEAAHRIAERGTTSERRLLQAMAEVAAESSPGAAAALADPAGSEVSRLRAFGLVHTHLLEALGPREHAWLLALLEGEGSLDIPDLVA